MQLKTATIERLRDALLKSGRRPSVVLSSAYEVLTREALLSPEETTALSRVDPLAETMYLMMASDGQVLDAERVAIRGAIRGLTGDALRSGTIKVMLEAYRSRLENEGREKRLQDIADAIADEPADAEAAFTLAAAVALADNQVADEENAFINQLATWFKIPEPRAHEILDQLAHDGPGSSEA